MSWPAPVPGLVVDRPCAVVLVLLDADDPPQVRVLPITQAAPAVADDALEIPPATKARLGLDSERSWVVLTEANDFRWPVPTCARCPAKGRAAWSSASCRRGSSGSCASV